MSGQVSRGSAGEYQADERAGMANNPGKVHLLGSWFIIKGYSLETSDRRGARGVGKGLGLPGELPSQNPQVDSAPGRSLNPFS